MSQIQRYLYNRKYALVISFYKSFCVYRTGWPANDFIFAGNEIFKWITTFAKQIKLSFLVTKSLKFAPNTTFSTNEK